ncbi:tRNA adenosine(34) deaminase TadA [Brooklawnia cerclae]|uniref:tRNA-specific adenosine deaminase n=2 Tax=Brooklawnia cerclae TaxID=349934 RepID=A0ABX0SJH5_9ACTN|nr:tRNA(adenine34) deaminase [Brooklawnia cerclae]
MSRWDDAMRLALDRGVRAGEQGDVPVGAVVLSPERDVLAAAGNERELTGDPTAHAEIVAIRQACRVLDDGWRLEGCTLVVTLEPCVMCAGAIVAARIARVVFGAFDPKAGAVASNWDLLRDPRLVHRPVVVSGVLAAEAEAGLRDFFERRRD